jgi:hypothetical protein
MPFSLMRSITSVAVICGVSVRIWNSVTRKASLISDFSSCIISSVIWMLPAGSACTSSLPSLDTPPLLNAPGAWRCPHAVVGGEEHGVRGAVALLQEHALLGVQGLDRGEHLHRRRAPVDFAGRLVVAAGRHGEGV